MEYQKTPSTNLLFLSFFFFVFHFPQLFFLAPSAAPQVSNYRCPVLGAGFAGLSVAWHLLQHGSRDLPLLVDIYDEVGICAGASGVAGGLLHPYSPEECWNSCWRTCVLKLQIGRASSLKCVEDGYRMDLATYISDDIFYIRGILRPAVSLKNINIMDHVRFKDYILYFSMDKHAAENLVPGLSVPLNVAFHMPEALNVHSQYYLENLWIFFSINCHLNKRVLQMHERWYQSIISFSGEYNAVVICLGARAAFLPEFSGILPLRTCRGVVTHMQLSDNIREEYPQHSPSILSDAWLAVQMSSKICIWAQHGNGGLQITQGLSQQ
ncbi:unnamed protein product [Coffea canephora]|uniref:FAD dependent oxidoreductase domain-containing protein n=1 Tax=Coffea canephora TaxID=49390 RepID=A0A068V0V4_COFCA|nr:unnamed protein product [Coffea canephora]